MSETLPLFEIIKKAYAKEKTFIDILNSSNIMLGEAYSTRADINFIEKMRNMVNEAQKAAIDYTTDLNTLLNRKETYVPDERRDAINQNFRHVMTCSIKPKKKVSFKEFVKIKLIYTKEEINDLMSLSDIENKYMPVTNLHKEEDSDHEEIDFERICRALEIAYKAFELEKILNPILNSQDLYNIDFNTQNLFRHIMNLKIQKCMCHIKKLGPTQQNDINLLYSEIDKINKDLNILNNYAKERKKRRNEIRN